MSNVQELTFEQRVRREALLVCGFPPKHEGMITVVHPHADYRVNIESALGRVLLRALNAEV